MWWEKRWTPLNIWQNKVIKTTQQDQSKPVKIENRSEENRAMHQTNRLPPCAFKSKIDTFNHNFLWKSLSYLGPYFPKSGLASMNLVEVAGTKRAKPFSHVLLFWKSRARARLPDHYVLILLLNGLLLVTETKKGHDDGLLDLDSTSAEGNMADLWLCSLSWSIYLWYTSCICFVVGSCQA